MNIIEYETILVFIQTLSVALQIIFSKLGMKNPFKRRFFYMLSYIFSGIVLGMFIAFILSKFIKCL